LLFYLVFIDCDFYEGVAGTSIAKKFQAFCPKILSAYFDHHIMLIVSPYTFSFNKFVFSGSKSIGLKPKLPGAK
jgi:hypothetical protein